MDKYVNTCAKVIKAKYKIVTMRTVEIEKVRVYIETKVTNQKDLLNKKGQSPQTYYNTI